MRKFSVNTEKKKKKLTSEEIKSFKNFSKLSHDYEKLTKRSKRPLYKEPKLFLYLFLLGLILYLIFMESK